MATVTGKTSSKIDQLLADTLVGAELDEEGTLVFTRKSGGTINAGSLGASIVGAVINGAKHLIFTTMHGEQIDAGSIIPNVLDAAWPVGSVYIGITPTNPNTLLGGGTWVRFAKGQMIIGVDEADLSFDAVEETGGSKTKALIAANLPPHVHTIAHDHTVQGRNSAVGAGGGAQTSSVQNAGGTGAVIANTAVNGSSAPNTGNGPGTSAPIDVMNPFITAYVWKRTA